MAAQYKEEVDKLANMFPKTVPVTLEMHRSMDEVETLVEGHDVVIR